MLSKVFSNEKILATLSLQIPLLYLIYRLVPSIPIYYAILLVLVTDSLVFSSVVSWKHILASIVLGATVSIIQTGYFQQIIVLIAVLLSTLIYYNALLSIFSTLAYFIMLSYRIYGLKVFTLKTYIALNLSKTLGFDEILMFSLGILIPLMLVFAEKYSKHNLVCFVLSVIAVSTLYIVSLVNIYTSHITIIGLSLSILIFSIARIEE